MQEGQWCCPMLMVEGICRWGQYIFVLWTLDNQRICDGNFVLMGPRLVVLHCVDGQ
jgi:hypothetical protein